MDADLLPGYVTAWRRTWPRPTTGQLDALGFQGRFHALGDGAVRDALDGIEAALAANGRSDTRSHLAHLQVAHPDGVPRFARLGAIAIIQPLRAAHEPRTDELTIPFLGRERAAWEYPFGALSRSGDRLAAGGDWPATSPDPLQGIHVAVNRVTPDGGDTPVFLPAERVGHAEALTAYTAGPARVNHLDDTGQVRVGGLADLVVLDPDPPDPPDGPTGRRADGPTGRRADGGDRGDAGRADIGGGRASIRSSGGVSSNTDHGQVTC